MQIEISGETERLIQAALATAEMRYGALHGGWGPTCLDSSLKEMSSTLMTHGKPICITAKQILHSL